MKRSNPAIRTPIRKQGAEEYLLITLLSFALSVSVTRLFLYMTGYPQIGGGELHIAHVLWGGLLLFVAALLPLLLANRWVYTTSAVISGIGVGLFIDEVGKFITSTNDYFYPWAAPIIYVFFLMTVLLYLRMRRPARVDYRADLYYILEDLQEVLDHDLSEKERADILAHLKRVQNLSHHPDLVDLSKHIEEFITNQDIQVLPNQPTWLDRVRERLARFEQHRLNRLRYRAVLAGALAAVGVWSLVYPFYILSKVFTHQALEPLLVGLFTDRIIRSPTAVNWYTTMVSLEVVTGLLLLTAGVLIAMGRDRRGFPLSYIGLLFSLAVVNVLVFYFDQFSTIINSTVQFFVLLFALRYRKLFIAPRK